MTMHGAATPSGEAARPAPADESRDRAQQPQPRAPLPPGQGTRIDIRA
jgi:hypothetical protein